jgi:signal transduction histidine kinase
MLSDLSALRPEASLDAPNRDDTSSIGIVLPIKDGDKLIGAVACSLEIDLGGLPMAGSQGLLWLIFATGMTLAILVGIALSGFFTRRVARLAGGVDAVTAGDFTQRIAVSGGDELDRLAVAFNTMSEQLQDYRRLQARLRRKERFATLGEVAAGFAHEVRNPLGIIKTTAELVQRRPTLEAADKRRLGYVADEVRRIDRLIRDFLVFARPAQRSVTVTVGDLVERALSACRAAAEAKGVEFHVENHAGDALLSVDLDQMVQAFLNLVLNALDAMGDEGGRISIRLGLAEAPGTLAVTISDTGPGIPPELLERIFDPFVTTKAQGTGLGLATVFAIVESHGGWIEARNGADGGAVFELTLPVAGATQPMPER